MSQATPLKTLSKGLAGALAIASGTSAYGTIVFVNPPSDLTNIPGGTTTTRSWDVNGDGTSDFIFQNRYPNTPPGGYGVVWQMNMNPLATGNGLLSYDGQFIRYAHAVNVYQTIGPGRPGFSTQSQVALGSKYSYGSAAGKNYYGGFASGFDYQGDGYLAVSPGTFAYAGFRFQAADGTHYGWIRLRVNAGIIDFDIAAYNTTPNQPIATVPEPGTMALLAMGAIGVISAVTRRRRHE